MRDRALLHRTKLDAFRAWLVANGYDPSGPRGDFEVLRWKGKPRKQMPMIFDRMSGDHLTSNCTATEYVLRFIRDSKKAADGKEARSA